MPVLPIEDVALTTIKEYTRYITSSRVLPHLDLKPVQRRILWSMIKAGARHGKSGFRKVTSIVGLTMCYHPHGDSSISGALISLATSPNNLIAGRGNYGNIYGDAAASARYIEACTSPIFEELFDNTMMKLGEFIPSYDEKDVEPTILQTKLPLAPLVGVSGIGIGLTSNLPSYHISSVKDLVRNEINGTTIHTPSYAYGASICGPRIYPVLSSHSANNKDYLRITGIPRGSSVNIINSPVLHNLKIAKQIEILDDSVLDTVDIKIYAPIDIQEMIINNISRPIVENFAYYWKKLRKSGYIGEWLSNRLEYVRRREYYDQVEDWKDVLVKTTLSELSKATDLRSSMDTTIDNVYNSIKVMPPAEVSDFVPTLDQFRDIIKSKPISQIKDYAPPALPTINTLSDADIKQIISVEVDNVDEKLFSPKSIPVKAISTVPFKGTIKRYAAIRGYSVEIKYSPIPRLLNYEINDSINILYHNNTIEPVDKYYSGIKESDQSNNYVAGFSIPGRPTVIITESNKMIAYTRLSMLKEPIKSAFPATKIEVNGKVYVVANGIYVDNVISYKILEV